MDSGLCDDMLYGSKRKRMSIDQEASADALSFFFGDGASSVPFAPRLFSASIRCLMLAKELRKVVELSYVPYLERTDIPFDLGPRRGVPLSFYRGTDTAYVVFYDSDLKRKLTLNLSRLEQNVCFAENLSADGQRRKFVHISEEQFCGIAKSKKVRIRIEAKSGRAINFALLQFPLLQKIGKTAVSIEVDEELAQLALDIFASFFDRLRRRRQEVGGLCNEACVIAVSEV